MNASRKSSVSNKTLSPCLRLIDPSHFTMLTNAGSNHNCLRPSGRILAECSIVQATPHPSHKISLIYLGVSLLMRTQPVKSTFGEIYSRLLLSKVKVPMRHVNRQLQRTAPT